MVYCSDRLNDHPFYSLYAYYLRYTCISDYTCYSDYTHYPFYTKKIPVASRCLVVWLSSRAFVPNGKRDDWASLGVN